MKLRDVLSLLFLSALWGASYLFMRLGAGEFGAVVFGGMRAVLATAVLLPLLIWKRQASALRTHWQALVVVGLTQSALPFVLFGFAAPRINSGLAAILGATTPLFTAIIARLWTQERMVPLRVCGLVIGFGGVVVLAAQKSDIDLLDGVATYLAMAACVGAAVGYAFSANYAKLRTAGLPVLAVATGSQLAAGLMLAPLVVWSWPVIAPSGSAWAALLALAVLGTAVAYVLFFQLIARLGPSRTVTVAFMVPVFGVFWGWLCLGETVGLGLIAGGLIVLAGTALTIVSGGARLRLAARRWFSFAFASHHG